MSTRPLVALDLALANCRPIPDDGGGNLNCYNDELAATPEEEKKWFTMNWLFAECYLYVLSS